MPDSSLTPRLVSRHPDERSTMQYRVLTDARRSMPFTALTDTRIAKRDGVLTEACSTMPYRFIADHA
eukprot:2706718-Rhodomonas_salina.2